MIWSRGFGFVTFKTVEGAHRALSDPSKTIEVCSNNFEHLLVCRVLFLLNSPDFYLVLLQGRHVIVKLAAEGQRERQQQQVSGLQVQAASQVQPTYAANPNLTNYARPQVQAQAAPTLGFSAYTPGLAYATQSAAYAGLTATPQAYGAVATTQQYNPAQYPYAAFQAPQAGQAGIPAGAAGGAGALPTYYTGSS